MFEHIRHTAPDLYLSLLLTPAAARPQLAALYALEAELLAIPSRVTQPTLGVLRVTWWRDALLAGDTTHPLLAELAAQWQGQGAGEGAGQGPVLADFADSFSVMFEDLSADALQKIITARAMLWATLVASALQVPVPQAYAAAQAHYDLPVQGSATVRPLLLLIRLGQRRKAGKTGWLGAVWTAIKTGLQ